MIRLLDRIDLHLVTGQLEHYGTILSTLNWDVQLSIRLCTGTPSNEASVYHLPDVNATDTSIHARMIFLEMQFMTKYVIQNEDMAI